MATLWACRLLLIIASLCATSLVVSGLSPAEFYRIKFGRKKNRDSVSFLALGDWGRGGEFNQSAVATKMGEVGKKLNIDFVISTGDNFYHEGLKGVDDPFFQESFTDIYTAKSLQKPWYTVLGNHDYLGDVEAQLSTELRIRDKRWFCQRNFIVAVPGLVDIVFIDTTPFVEAYFINAKKQNFDWKGILPREEYLSQLLSNLDLTLKKSKATWKVVIGHHAIRSIGYHGDTKEIVERVLPILEENKVDMYINGHDHCLEHISSNEGTMQFLTSGGGSKAWKNIIHRDQHNDTTHFYYDGQGFVSVELIRKKAYVTYFDVMGKPIYSLKIK